MAAYCLAAIAAAEPNSAIRHASLRRQGIAPGAYARLSTPASNVCHNEFDNDAKVMINNTEELLDGTLGGKNKEVKLYRMTASGVIAQ